HLRDALTTGAIQIAVSLAAMALLAHALGFATPAAVTLGMMTALSSTALVIRLLAERGELDAPQGQLILGILLFQDLCFVPFLLAIPLLAGAAGVTLGAVSGQVALTIGTAVVF
ncbi:MAG: sodium:proton exchanger, partial [Gammaproteobacteria bacterium]|nr:sodium:proton exchanger [Gammaproteobacteria bacterium]